MDDDKKVRLITKILKDWEIDIHISEHLATGYPKSAETLLEGLAKEILLAIGEKSQ